MRIRAYAVFFLLPMIAACSMRGPVPTLAFGSNAAARPLNLHWTQFTVKTAGALFTGATVGPDKNIWFIDENGGGIVMITPAGTVTELPTNGSPYDMVVGSDKAFWITTQSNTVIRETTLGATTTYSTKDTEELGAAALGPDGNVWFPEYGHIAKISHKGVVTEYAYPHGHNTNDYGSVVAGPDGKVWFAESQANELANIVPSTGVITEHPIPQPCIPAELLVPKDKNIWFSCLSTGPNIGKYDIATGVFTFYTSPYLENDQYTMRYGTVGADGNPWFGSSGSHVIYEVRVSNGSIAHYNAPTGDNPDSIVKAPNGDIWVVTVNGTYHVDVYNPN